MSSVLRKTELQFDMNSTAFCIYLVSIIFIVKGHTHTYVCIQSTPLNRITSVRGHFALIKENPINRKYCIYSRTRLVGTPPGSGKKYVLSELVLHRKLYNK